MKIILHFGAHKTASTHLQYNLALNRQVLAQYGVVYFKFQERPKLHRQSRSLRRNTRNPKYDMETTKNTIRQEIETAIKGYDAALLSFEGILGPLNHNSYSDLYPYAEDVITLYGDILQPFEVIPVLSTRDYDSFLRSTYKWELKFNSHYFPYSLNEYMTNKKISFHRWTQILEKMGKTFSTTPQFYAYEDYRENAETVLLKILRLTEKPIPKEDLIQDHSDKNVSEKTASLDLYYTLNQHFRKLPNFKGKQRLHQFLLTKLHRSTSKKWLKKRLKPHLSGSIPSVNDPKEYQREVKILYQKYGLFTPENQLQT